MWVTLLCLLLSGCSYQVVNFPNKTAQIYNSSDVNVSSIPRTGYHRVNIGETLLSIAFNYGLDYRQVAKLNRIDAPYTIYPKQKIWLINTSKAISKNTKNTSVRPSNEMPKVEKTASDIQLQRKSSNLKKVSSWHRPLDGSIVKGFSSDGVGSKGIDIKGQKGDLVKAAADGTVVYAGDGLIGYGNLVIVKHNDTYLSAYAYNERILVQEQQKVRAGDALALIGGKGKEKSLLHFEVRRDGQPINPLNVLPK